MNTLDLHDLEELLSELEELRDLEDANRKRIKEILELSNQEYTTHRANEVDLLKKNNSVVLRDIDKLSESIAIHKDVATYQVMYFLEHGGLEMNISDLFTSSLITTYLKRTPSTRLLNRLNFLKSKFENGLSVNQLIELGGDDYFKKTEGVGPGTAVELSTMIHNLSVPLYNQYKGKTA